MSKINQTKQLMVVVDAMMIPPHLVQTPPNASQIIDEMRSEATLMSNPPSSLRHSSKLENVVVYETPTKNILPKLKFEQQNGNPTKLTEVSYKNYVGLILSEKR
jgi:hypothetical protein